MRKIWTIAWKELYVRFTDRHLIIIMIVTPLAISTIVGLAFGGIDEEDVPIRDIPVAIINHDRGNDYGVNYGQIFLSLLVPGISEDGDIVGALPVCDSGEGEVEDQEASTATLLDLTRASVFDEAAANALVGEGRIEVPTAASEGGYLDSAAKAAVDAGEYVAAIIIDADFSQNLTYVPILQTQLKPTGVTVYVNPGSPISAGIIRSIAEGIVNQIVTGSITIASTFDELQGQFGSMVVGQAASSMDFNEAFACAFSPASNTIRLETQEVESSVTRNTGTEILVSIGSAQAMFFALFIAQFGVLSMHEERRNWTLQRLVMSPTPRSAILAGKLVGVFVSVAFQLLVLFFALTLIGSIMQGRPTLIWGSDLPAILLVLFSAALGVSGLGMLMAGIVQSPEQAQIFGYMLNMALAVLGGAFGFTLPKAVSQLSLLYWGRNAFDMLAAGQSGVGLNVIILAGQGLLMFAIGLVLFNRRFEV
jgi:ABC-type transport system involved in multi-copper enzyme maturation permease subunit